MNVTIEVDNFMSINLDIPQKVKLIDFIGIVDKVKKLGKTIEIPMQIETETGITNEVKNKIRNYYTQAISYAKISENIKRDFGIELQRQQLQEIVLELGLIKKILTPIKKTYQPTTNPTDLTIIYRNEALLNQIAEKVYKVNYASSKLAQWLNVREYNVSIEQGKEIKNYLRTHRNDLRTKYLNMRR